MILSSPITQGSANVFPPKRESSKPIFNDDDDADADDGRKAKVLGATRTVTTAAAATKTIVIVSILTTEFGFPGTSTLFLSADYASVTMSFFCECSIANPNAV